MPFYDNVCRLCSDRGIKISAMLLDLNMSKAAATKWKNGGKPTRSSVLRIAEYLGVSKECLLTDGVYDGVCNTANIISEPSLPSSAVDRGTDLLSLVFSQQEAIRELVVSNRELSGTIKALIEKKNRGVVVGEALSP